MYYNYQFRESDSPCILRVWRSHPDHDGDYMDLASQYWHIVFNTEHNKTKVFLFGPAMVSKPVKYIANGYYWGLVFESHVFMPHLPKRQILNATIQLQNKGDTFIFNGQEITMPSYETAEKCVEELLQKGVITADEFIAKALAGEARMSKRSFQRHIVKTTGLTNTNIQQIQRARQAFALLQTGKSIAHVAAETGYVDQSHLTKSLKVLAGQTPAQILSDYNA